MIVEHVATREDHEQVYTYRDLLSVKIKGTGEAANRDLFPFYDEWMRISGEMPKPHRSFRPAIQEHVYTELSKCSVMTMSLGIYDHSNDEYGTGVRSYQWLIKQVGKKMVKNRMEENDEVSHKAVNQRGVVPKDGPVNTNEVNSSLYTKAGVLKKTIPCKKFLKNRCPHNAKTCQYSHNNNQPAAPAVEDPKKKKKEQDKKKRQE